MMNRICHETAGHVFARELGCTSCIIELTFNLLEGAIFIQMLIEVLALDGIASYVTQGINFGFVSMSMIAHPTGV